MFNLKLYCASTGPIVNFESPAENFKYKQKHNYISVLVFVNMWEKTRLSSM